jgi:hypothetical protein
MIQSQRLHAIETRIAEFEAENYKLKESQINRRINRPVSETKKKKVAAM